MLEKIKTFYSEHKKVVNIVLIGLGAFLAYYLFKKK
ncbi:hypothetical protein FLAT13_03350 [Flavobacterium salmonis]|uniref:Uncharacterized protein n=1 Tax=Flavobacterium salmonis TaxID=2654844 RepID=A0A6V6Z451_9FLAO|nr:hypothetical protein FLAT13_03350 [Flavobacterium salmonis]